MYTKVPANGLVVLTGTVIENENSKARKEVKVSFEPIRPITSFLYLCDSNFHIEQLEKSLTDNKVYGIVVMDGNGFLLATLSGSDKKIIYRETVDLPKKHGRGQGAASSTGSRHIVTTKVSQL